MAWFHNLPLRRKLLGAFGVILALVLAFSALAYRMSLLEERASREVERNLEILVLANDAYVNLVNMQTGYRGFLLVGDEAFLEPYAEGQQSYPVTLTALAALDRDEVADAERWREAEQRARDWQRAVTEPGIALRRQVNADAIPAARVSAWVSTAGGKAQFDAIRVLFEVAIADEQAELTTLGADARAAEQRLRAALVWGTAGTIGLAILVAILLSRDIVGSVGRVAEAAQEIGRGRLDHRVGLRRTDEIGQTAAVFDRMAGRLQQMVQELERAVAAARASEARAGALTDNVAEGIFTFDERGVLASFNRAAERIFGYRATEVVGQHVDLLLPKPDGGTRTEVPWSEDGIVTGVSRELPGRRAGGALFPMDLVVSDMRLGGQRQFIGVARDISERKRAGQRLRESEERLRLALDAARMGTWERNLLSHELIWSDKVKLLHGLPPAAAGDLRAHFERTIHPDDRDAVARQETHALATRADYDVEYRVVRPDGSVRWVAAKGRVDRGENGQPPRLHGVATDVTARKRLELELHQSVARQRALLDAIPDLMFRLDRHGTYLDVKAEHEADLTVPRDTLIGKTAAEVLPAAIAEQVVRTIDRALATGRTEVIEYRLRVEAEERDFEARVVPCADDEVLALVRDITERKAAEAAVRESERRYRDVAAAAQRQARELALLDEVRTALARKMTGRSSSAPSSTPSPRRSATPRSASTCSKTTP